MWDSHQHILYALEMKTVSGKSISFERNATDQGEIHLHQIEGLMEWDQYDGIVCGFVIEFRTIATTIFISISDFKEITDKVEKKSFTISDLDSYHIPYLIIPQRKLRTRYKYDMEHLVKEIGLNKCYSN